jgi:hypothetical protein
VAEFCDLTDDESQGGQPSNKIWLEHGVSHTKIVVGHRFCCQAMFRARQAKGLEFSGSKCMLLTF